MYAHERAALSAVAESIARLNGYRYAGVFDANEHSSGDVFFVPDDTLMLDDAHNLGIHSPRQIYGAVVPYPFAKTKAITHGLINAHAPRPCGWSAAFAENVSNAVLSGYTLMIGDRALAYHGTQRSVTNNHGLSVYGGSHLVCVRGGFAELEHLPMNSEVRLAITQARTYDRNASLYPGFLASRRNYDVGQGIDGRGQWRSGVFEASWRSGGASTAELAALRAFEQDSALQVVEASSVKQFGKPSKIPPGSIVHFEGDDPEEGPLLRYTVITRTLRCAA